GRHDEAQNLCEAAIEADKLDPVAYYLLATILIERGEYEDASRSLKRALYLDQNFAAAHFAMGNSARRLGNFRESNKHFKNALSILSRMEKGDTPPEMEGMTAGGLMEIILSIMGK